MRESEEYKKNLSERKNETYDDLLYNSGFIEGYENKHEIDKEYLEWQKPEDVELVDGKMYLIKKDNEIPFVAYWDKKSDGFLKAIFNPEMDSLYSRYNLLIKKIEV